MADEPHFDLAAGFSKFITGLQIANPQLSIEETETLGNDYLREMGGALQSGEQIASVKILPNGDFSLRIWSVRSKEEN
jgi:hypothetical protein